MFYHGNGLGYIYGSAMLCRIASFARVATLGLVSLWKICERRSILWQKEQ